jgi:hypothetical protein
VPTARELLEQADALMRRNRLATTHDDDIPVLTEEVAATPVALPPPAPSEPAKPQAPPTAAISDLDDVPLLTDAVEEIEAPSILETPEDEAGAEAWNDTLTASRSTQAPVLGKAAQDAPAEEATPPSVESIEISPPPIEEPAQAQRHWYDPNEAAMAPPPPADVLPLPSADVVPLHPGAPAPVDDTEPAPVDEPSVPAEQHAAAAKSADDEARWNQLAEEVRMQVLQRIDLFTDTGLREQLAARLQPIVDRAGADLVATINQHVGVLLRAYVAEAIEREIERWRSQGR